MRCFTKFQFDFIRGKASWPDKAMHYDIISGKRVVLVDKMLENT